jgi:hypothetical protein
MLMVESCHCISSLVGTVRYKIILQYINFIEHIFDVNAINFTILIISAEE